VSSLVELADADAMKESLGLARRQALWAIKALRDEPRTGVGRRLLA
jgi:error-prone DNA polymerase